MRWIELSALGWAGVIVLALAALYGAWSWYCRYRRVGVVFVEREFSINKPMRLVGRPDLVRRDAEGYLVVHDLKTRKSPRAFRSDVIQLSVYKVLLEVALGERVRDYAILCCQAPDGSRQEVPVKLMSQEQVGMLVARYEAVSMGGVIGAASGAPAFCVRCVHYQRRCPGNPGTSAKKRA